MMKAIQHFIITKIFVLTILLVLTMNNNVYANNLCLWLNDSQVPDFFFHKDLHDNLYISVKKYCEIVNIKFCLDKKEKFLSIRNKDNLLYLFFEKEKTRAILNDEFTNLELPVILRQDQVLIPIDPISIMLGVDLQFRNKDFTVLPQPHKTSSEPVEQLTQKELTKMQRRFGLQIGCQYIGPDIGDFGVDKKWCLSYSSNYRLSQDLTAELRYDSFKSRQSTTLLFEPAVFTAKVTAVTGYVNYIISDGKWNFNFAVGAGLHSFNVNYDSLTIDSHYHRWFKIDTFEFKLGVEYPLNQSSSIELEARAIFGKDTFDLGALKKEIHAGYDNVFLGTRFNYYF